MTLALSASAASASGPSPVAAASAMPDPALPRRPSLLRDLMVLTKFRINLVGVITGYAAIALSTTIHTSEIDLLRSSGGMLWLNLLALLLTGGAANTMNQVLEVKRDGAMSRTRDRRPLPAGRIPVWVAATLAAVQLAGAVALFVGVFGSWLAAALAGFTVFYYAVIYTLWLKPRHYLNIVIGGVPGAMGPLLAWAAIHNTVSWEAFALFMIVFLWTPPHFWALAIRIRDDYAKAGIPMLPVVKGVDETTRQIFIYTVVLVAATLAVPLLLPAFRSSPVYTILALLLGAIFLIGAWRLWRQRPITDSMPLFHYSIAYIALLFVGVIIDAALTGSAV